MNDLIEQVIQYYEQADGVCVYRNLEVCDTDYTSIWTNNDTMYFEFDEDEIKDFKFGFNEIKEIIFDQLGDMPVSIIKLNNGDSILIHNL